MRNLAKIFYLMFIWDKVFKNGPSKICGRQPLKNLKRYGLLTGCLLQILLGPFLNTFSHLLLGYSVTLFRLTYFRWFTKSSGLTKISENQRFFNVFRGYRKRLVERNG